ncbi:MAG: hypothetical protein ACRDY2_08585 [Acidimicrobiales bacterium]
MPTTTATTPSRPRQRPAERGTPEISHLLTLGTGHVPPEANDDDWWANVPASPVEQGWWVYVPTHSFDGVLPDMPGPIRDILLAARRLGCAYVHLDVGGPQFAELDWWEW